MVPSLCDFWYNREHRIRWVLGVVQDGLMSNGQFSAGTEIMACIRVAVPTREATACHVQANTMPGFEDIAGGPEVDLVLVGHSWLNQRGRFSARKVAIASTDNALGEILRITTRMHIYHARHKIVILCAPNSPQLFLAP